MKTLLVSYVIFMMKYILQHDICMNTKKMIDRINFILCTVVHKQKKLEFKIFREIFYNFYKKKLIKKFFAKYCDIYRWKM